jgi:hypothetical protein
MRKIKLVYLLLAVSLMLSLSASTNINDSTNYIASDFYKKTEAFIPNNLGTFTYFYSNPNGVIRDSLKSTKKHQWIIVTIDSIDSDWVKLKKVVFGPEDSSVPSPPNLKDTWIPITGLYTQLNDPIQTFKIHDSPSKKSTSHEYKTVKILNIIGIKKDWIKVRFIIQGYEYSGWINKINVCPYPWTICGY